MQNKLFAAIALALTSGGTGALTIEGLPTWGKVVAVSANALGMALALVFDPPVRKAKKLELPR